MVKERKTKTKEILELKEELESCNSKIDKKERELNACFERNSSTKENCIYISVGLLILGLIGGALMMWNTDKPYVDALQNELCDNYNMNFTGNYSYDDIANNVTGNYDRYLVCKNSTGQALVAYPYY